MLLQFLNWFAPAIVGKEEWNATCRTKDLSTIMSVGDEAFLYLTVEGNYDKWRYMLTTVRWLHYNDIAIIFIHTLTQSTEYRNQIQHAKDQTQTVHKGDTLAATRSKTTKQQKLLQSTRLETDGPTMAESDTVTSCQLSTNHAHGTTKASTNAWLSTQLHGN